jgi:uncharacterized Zn-binding protein involved in type VI secretion
MPDAKVFANDRSIVHAGDGLSQASATPDVCKTPGPNGATPVPYPNVARDQDLAKGTKQVKIAGKSVAIAGANLRTSSGDEAGTAGGGMFSSKTKGKATWLGGSPNVLFEGKKVIRFGDAAIHNGNASNAGGQPNVGKMSPGSDECGHTKLRREPEAGTFRYHDKERAGDGDLKAMEKPLEQRRRWVERAQHEYDAAKKAGVKTEALVAFGRTVERYADGHAGMEWEYLVGHDVDAQEMNVKIFCDDCGKCITEFDVIMGNGIVKECKKSWNAIDPSKLVTQMDVLERCNVLGPGRTLHVAIPKGERGRLDKKLENSALSKDDMRGRIQEH